MVYTALKSIILIGLHAYHKKIAVYGVQNIPKDKPVLFLPNHQSALLDVFLVATDFSRKPYFLTRSDVFGKPVLNAFFKYLRMIPVYRIRDGRDTLTKNDAIFDACAQVLTKGEAVTMFPEANHNLRRRVRPLSKGFTRVLFKALELSPELDIQIVPVGLNYSHALGFPDTVAVYYGQPIAVQELYDPKDLPASAVHIKDTVSARLKSLTTHITPAAHYHEINSYLKAEKVNFLNPSMANSLVQKWSPSKNKSIPKKVTNTTRPSPLYPLFLLLNFPVVLLWKLLVRPKVWEAEFTGTLRFATALVGFFVYYAVLLIVVATNLNIGWAIGAVATLFVFNWFYVKYAQF